MNWSELVNGRKRDRERESKGNSISEEHGALREWRGLSAEHGGRVLLTKQMARGASRLGHCEGKRLICGAGNGGSLELSVE